MDADVVLGLSGFALISTITPGGATAIATATGAHFGLRRSLPVLSGICVALAIMAAVAAAGLSGLLTAVPILALALRIAGTAYLLWLAVRTARSGSPHQAERSSEPISLTGGAVLLLYNPKGWAMTTAAAAAFSTLSPHPVTLALAFAVVFAVASGISLTVWCLLGMGLRRVLRTPRQWAGLNLILAVLLVASIIPIWLEG
ncbi:LysE family translocator [Nakamurella sp. A5-74]|uniref:LysE family translocator n=1 Tax=Nakamurella sp. A5-74 TaxID=3158264 RepID=A0AAU8DR07_9ACTN